MGQSSVDHWTFILLKRSCLLAKFARTACFSSLAFRFFRIPESACNEGTLPAGSDPGLRILVRVRQVRFSVSCFAGSDADGNSLDKHQRLSLLLYFLPGAFMGSVATSRRIVEGE